MSCVSLTCAPPAPDARGRARPHPISRSAFTSFSCSLGELPGGPRRAGRRARSAPHASTALVRSGRAAPAASRRRLRHRGTRKPASSVARRPARAARRHERPVALRPRGRRPAPFAAAGAAARTPSPRTPGRARAPQRGARSGAGSPRARPCYLRSCRKIGERSVERRGSTVRDPGRRARRFLRRDAADRRSGCSARHGPASAICGRAERDGAPPGSR